ncbi:MAG: hypothetical protein WC211_01010 [Dehalococcoidia bacterium]
MTTPSPNPKGRLDISLMSTGAAGIAPQRAPRGLWLPATAIAGSTALAALAGVTLGILAALHWSIATDRWIEVVQAHGFIQAWGWFAVSIAALVFEFIVRLNRQPMLPFAPRATVLSLFALGAVLASSAGVLGVATQPLLLAGTLALLAGSIGYAWLVLRVPFGVPLRFDLHPLFFRAGAVWLVVAALLGVLGAAQARSGGMLPASFDAMTEMFLRGFVFHTIVAVGLRAFPGHVGLPPVQVPAQRPILVLLTAGVLLRIAGAPGFGLPSTPILVTLADLSLVAAIAWATWVFRLDTAVRAWSRSSDRAQVLVPVAWIGLVAYGVALAWQAGAVLLGGSAPTLLAAGGARHLYMLGFVAPLLVAMLHVVLERFGTGYLHARGWLTAAFALLVLAWPLRTLPPLLDPAGGPATEATMGIAGLIVTVALLLAALAAARNALPLLRPARGRSGR